MIPTPATFVLPEPLDNESCPPPKPPTYMKHQVYDDPNVFEKVDYHAIRVARNTYPTFRDLLWDLVFRYKLNDLEKARVIFRWMTSCDMNALSFQTSLKGSPEEVLLSLKNLKGSYANALELMCSYSGLFCLTISGYAKGVDYRPGDIFQDQAFNHSWNVIYIQDSWQLIDAHWATRYLTARKNTQDSIVYQYDDFYFIMEPQQAVYSHFPQVVAWQLLKEPLTIDQFENLPLTKSQFFKCGMDFKNQHHGVVHPKDGNLKMTLGFWKPDSFTYKLVTDKNSDVFQGISLKYFVIQETVNNQINFYFRFPAPGNYYLTVFVQELNEHNQPANQENIFRAACEYKIIADKAASNSLPYPMSCHDLNWGPQWSLISHYNLTPVQEDGVISISSPNGKPFVQTEIKFEKSREEVGLLCKLRKNGVEDEDILDQYIEIIEKPDYTAFVLNLPEPGEYGLEIYANEPSEGDTFTHVCQYLLDFQPPAGYKPQSSVFGPIKSDSSLLNLKPSNIREMYNYEKDASPMGALPKPYLVSQYAPEDVTMIPGQSKNKPKPFAYNQTNKSDESDIEMPDFLPPPPPVSIVPEFEQKVSSSAALSAGDDLAKNNTKSPQPNSSDDFINQTNGASSRPIAGGMNRHSPSTQLMTAGDNFAPSSNKGDNLNKNNSTVPQLPSSDNKIHQFNEKSRPVIGGTNQYNPTNQSMTSGDKIGFGPNKGDNLNRNSANFPPPPPLSADDRLNQADGASRSITGGNNQYTPQNQSMMAGENIAPGTYSVLQGAKPFTKSYAGENSGIKIGESSYHPYTGDKDDELLEKNVKLQPYMANIEKGQSPNLSRKVYDYTGKNKSTDSKDPLLKFGSNVKDGAKVQGSIGSDSNQSKSFDSSNISDSSANQKDDGNSDSKKPAVFRGYGRPNFAAGQKDGTDVNIVTGPILAGNVQQATEYPPLNSSLQKTGQFKEGTSKLVAPSHLSGTYGTSIGSTGRSSPFKEDGSIKSAEFNKSGPYSVLGRNSPFKEENITVTSGTRLQGAYGVLNPGDSGNTSNPALGRNNPYKEDALSKSGGTNIPKNYGGRNSPYKEDALSKSGGTNIPKNYGVEFNKSGPYSVLGRNSPYKEDTLSVSGGANIPGGYGVRNTSDSNKASSNPTLDRGEASTILGGTHSIGSYGVRNPVDYDKSGVNQGSERSNQYKVDFSTSSNPDYASGTYGVRELGSSGDSRNDPKKISNIAMTLSPSGFKKPQQVDTTYDQYNNQYEDSSKLMPSPFQRYRPDESTANWTSGPVQIEPPKNFELKPIDVQEEVYKPEVQALPQEAPTLQNFSPEETSKIFQRIDDHALQVSAQHQDSFNQLIWQLIYARNITDELEKIRVIFLWLCTKDLHKMNFDDIKKDSPEEILMGLKSGKSTYAQIFLTLCRYAGLHCKLIVGYAKGADYVPGMQFQGRHGEHSWNAVLIGGVWRLVDCHWAARRLIGKERKPENVRYELDMFYFLANPSQLIYTHFPHEQDWQLLHHPINIEEFESLAPVKSMFFKYNLDLVTHKNAVINSDTPEFELRIAFPKGVEERLLFTFTLTLNDGKDDYNGISLLRYGRQEINYIDDHSSFWIRAPAPGSYKLLLYAKLIPADQSDTDSGSQNMFGAICEYKIEFDFPGRKAMSPFPPCQTSTYGPSEVYKKYAIESCITNSTIFTENGTTEIKFLIHKPDTRVMAKLISSSGKNSDQITEQCVLQRLIGTEEAVINVFLPDPGEYGLEIYANNSKKDGNSFYTVWQYFIVTACASTVNGLPCLPPGYLGPYEPKFSNYGLSTYSHKDPFIVANTGDICIQIKTTREKPVRMMTQLIHASHNVSEMCPNQVLQQARDSIVYFLIRFPHQGFFKLQIFALPYSEMSENLPGVFNYLIEGNHSSNQRILEFPQQFAQWKEGCYLYEPTDGILGVNLRPDYLTFRMDVPRATSMAIVVNNEWTKLEKDPSGSWAGNVDMRLLWGKAGVDQLAVCANYGMSVDDSFTTILKYSIQ